MTYDFIIIGGGAAGLYCACGIGQRLQAGKFRGLILEGSTKPGQKLLISGGGMANLTHGGSIKDFIPCYFEAGSKIRSCLYKHSNVEMSDFFSGIGLPLREREDGKVFPKSESARDVVNALVNCAQKSGFQILTEHKVSNIRRIDERLYEVSAAGKVFRCRNLIIACGGMSFPKTGSDGSILGVLARDLPELSKHIIEPRPALAPVYVEGYPYGSLSGVSFSNVTVTASGQDGKKLSSITGPILFAEKFLSGPAILHISRYLEPGCRLSINYLPDLKLTSKDINRILSESRKSPANTAAEAFVLPKSFTQLLEDEAAGKLSAISERLLSDTFVVSRTAGFDAAMATRGGISLDAVNPKAFEVKSYPGLFIIGETLDVDGMTGGYNLQFAYSSAMAAAEYPALL